VSGELVVADVSELYNNGIIGEFYRLIYSTYEDSGLPPPPLLAGTVAGSIQAGKRKDTLIPAKYMENMTKS
jgi:hypothetical protein